MERESQPAHSGLTEALRDDIWQVNFYRFCQLLEQENPDAPKLGSTEKLSADPVRFRPWPGMGFPVSELKAVETDEDHPDLSPTVRTTFLGMYGVDSPLPTAYLDDIAQRREGYEATTAFLDIFSHRIHTQYYRIWRKYAYPATFEAGGVDARYCDGVIPDESGYFLDDTQGERIQCRTGDKCPHSGQWATLAGGHQQFVYVREGDSMPEAKVYTSGSFSPDRFTSASWSLMVRDDDGSVFVGATGENH